MGGSTAAQFLYDAYGQNLAQAVTTAAGTVLGAINATVQGVLMLYIIILGKRMMFNALSWNEGVTAMVRAIIVMFLMTAANYQTWVATPVTQTIPTFINNTVTGAQGLTGAQGWDALINQVHNFTANIRAQTVGLAYIADRVIIWATGGMAEIVIFCCVFIWMLANATADFLVPLGGFVVPFYLFDTTRSFAERWFGKIVALFLVMAATLMLGQIVVYQDAQYMQKFAANIAARPADNGFNMNPDVQNPGAFQPTTAGEPAGGTVNVDSAIDTLGNVTGVFVFGLFLMVIVSGIALYIGGASGFSAAPAFNMAMAATRVLVRR
jgi:hypothetical protein